ncbi:MAG: phytanoyl-CoA dioxygenase family protein [Ilumatobacteraceae bacterium]
MSSVAARTTTEAQREEFRTKGFVTVRGLFPRAEAEAAATWLHAQDPDAVAKSWTEREPGVPLAVYSVAHEGGTPVSRVITDSRIAAIATELMGEETYIWSSKVNVKAAWCGAVEYYHQDFIYWQPRGYPRSDMLSCMVFLEPHRVANAALHLLPGTHGYGVMEHVPFVNVNGVHKVMIPPSRMRELHARHGIEAVEGEPGDAVFFHTLIVHGSAHNISPQGRMIALAQMNVRSNQPVEVRATAKATNVARAEFEVGEAERRLAYFRDKLSRQRAADDLTFNSPIPAEER